MKNWLMNYHKFDGKKKLVLKTAFILFMIKIGLVVLSFSSFKKLYSYLSKFKSNFERSTEDTVWAIKGVSYYVPFGFTCLPQALTLKYLLRHDKSMELIIGVNTDGGFTAHAWVEKESKFVIGDTPLEKYSPIWTWK